MEYGLIGERLGHSFSKTIHEEFGFYGYDLKEIPRDELDEFMIKREFKGINVTIPYKEDVCRHLDFIDEKAKAIGAVNTVVKKDGKLFGYNTDYFGLKNLLAENGFDLKEKKVLILGTGGTSKTAYEVCKDASARLIVKVSRSKRDGVVTYEEAYSEHSDANYIINTTPCGMYPNIDASPIELSAFTKLEGVADVIYNPGRTRLVLEAQKRGIKACSGLKMLIYQAVAACGFFTSNKADEGKIEEIYNKLFDANNNIVLTGMPGSGKSTIGRLLSERLGKNFVDTDELISKKEKREISEIFATDGEKYFREVEKEIIKEIASVKNSVVSTGGGVILNEENVKNLKANGTVYFLDRNVEELIPTDDRPLADKKEKIMKLYEERLPIYNSTCDVKINVAGGVEETLNEILSIHNGSRK